MLSVKKLLYKMLNMFGSGSGTVSSLSQITRSSLEYYRVGKLVIVNGYIQLNATLPNNTAIFSDLPLSWPSNVTPLVVLNTSQGTYTHAFLNESGVLYTSGSWATGYSRISGAYLTNVGGGVLRNLSIFKAFSDCKPSERMVASC